MSEDNTPPEDLESTKAFEPEGGSVQRIGNYRILQKIGEGGMGEVYEAEQEKPVRRRVALKVIKAGMDTKQVVARFEAERQALAMMNHPNVAKVFDAGATEQGRPYFAMELVKGEPITKHCDRQRLTTQERLMLFMHVCEGVQHAHQKGIIHRDIKPSNILVQTEDDKRIPKIIDFGVAKATQQRLTERTLFTELGVLIGTPEYMSPEQAEMTIEDIDTRTDVYSLGVLLYEILVGALPFDPKELRCGGFDEIRRRIREDEPSKPSTRLDTLGDASAESAEKRRTDLPTLRRQLRGDLDWITLKVLEKDRTRRYGSPSELAADIQRHLKHEPVLASPPSTAYRMGKYVRRHRVGVALAAIAVLLLAGIAVRERIQSSRIASERDRTRQEAETARQALDFMTGLFEVSDPSEARGNQITAREILDRGVEQVEQTLGDQPEVHARLASTMGTVYRSLGLYAPSEELFGKSLEIRRRVLGELHPDTLESINEMGVLLQVEGKLDEAEPFYREALEGRRQALGLDHPDTLESLNDMGYLLHARGKFAEAERFYREALEGKRRILGDDHQETLISIDNLGVALKAQGKLDEAEPYYLESLEGKRRVLGDDHPDTLTALNNMGSLLQAQQKLNEAEPYYLQALRGFRRVLGNDHPNTIVALNNLGSFLEARGKLSDAEPYYRDALAGFRRVLGEDHPNTFIVMGNLGNLYTNLQRHKDAEELLVEALEGTRRVLSEEHYVTGRTLRKYGRCLTGLNRYPEAETALLEAHDILTATVGAEHSQTIKVTRDLIELYDAWGKPNKAAEWRARLPDTE